MGLINGVMNTLKKSLSTKHGKRARRCNTLRRCVVETLENRHMFSIAPIAPLGDLSTMLVPSGTSPVHFFWDYRDSSSNDELGYFFVDGPDGRITKRASGDPEGAPILTPNGLPQYVRPGDKDYAATALASANSAVAFASGEVPNHGKLDKILDVAGDHFMAFYIVQNATTDAWRAASNKPNIWFSIGNANSDNFEHFQTTNFFDSFYRRGLVQYKVEDSNISLAKKHVAGNDLDLNDVVFSVNILPFANEDDYSVFNAGDDFSGKPQGFKLSTPDDTKNQGLGLLWNDYLPSHPLNKPTVTDISIDGGDTWISVVDKAAHRTKVTVTSSSVLHGTVTVYPNGGVDFQPDVNDAWWHTTLSTSDTDPDAIEFEYRISDGIDATESSVTITHGFYQRGGPVDNKHNGQQMYLLAGGGSSAPFDAGRQRFFQEGSRGQDILLIAQGTEQLEFVNDVFDFYAAGKSRSVTSLNITTREQANDPRLSRYVNGADAIWFGGGAQSTYQTTWFLTRLYSSLAWAAASNVAIGGTSAGMAILSQAAYVDLPWDSVQSSFATERPYDPRVNIGYQGAQLPFTALAYGPNAPLSNFIADTHFSSRDRMGRLLAFAAKSHTRGLGVDDDTALLIVKVNGQWNWSVYGDGSVYLLAPSPYIFSKVDFDGRLTFGPVNVYKLSAGSQNLNTILRSSPSYRVWVSKGTVYTTDNGGSLY